MNAELRSQATHKFRERMEHKLEVNRDKPCPVMNKDGNGREWKHVSWQWLLDRLRQETVELEKALHNGNVDEIKDEAADVGNFAMMIHDNVHH